VKAPVCTFVTLSARAIRFDPRLHPRHVFDVEGHHHYLIPILLRSALSAPPQSILVHRAIRHPAGHSVAAGFSTSFQPSSFSSEDTCESLDKPAALARTRHAMIGAWLNVSSSPCFAWSSMISYAIVTPIYLHADPFCEYRQVADEQGWTTIELFSFVLVSCFWHALDVCALQRVVLEVCCI